MPAKGQFTPETGRLAQIRGVRVRNREFKLLRKTLENEKFAETIKLLTPVLNNPAVIGTILYLLVGTLKTAPGQSASATQSIFQGLVNAVGILTGNAGNAILSGATSAELANLDIEVLQAALLAYIASGGNLAGTLQNGANALSAITALIPK